MDKEKAIKEELKLAIYHQAMAISCDSLGTHIQHLLASSSHYGKARLIMSQPDKKTDYEGVEPNINP